MASGYFRMERRPRYRDLEELVDYREYDGEWTYWFEERWLAPRLRDLDMNTLGSSAAKRVSTMPAFENASVN
jgi:hypothetical protein